MSDELVIVIILGAIVLVVAKMSSTPHFPPSAVVWSVSVTFPCANGWCVFFPVHCGEFESIRLHVGSKWGWLLLPETSRDQHFFCGWFWCDRPSTWGAQVCGNVHVFLKPREDNELCKVHRITGPVGVISGVSGKSYGQGLAVKDTGSYR